MSRTKTILAAVGGVTAVAVAAAGYFAWSAQAAKTAALEGDEDGAVGLETVRAQADRLSRKPVYPGAESVQALTEARDALVERKDEAFRIASRGDRKIPQMTDAQFKEFLVGESRRLQSLPAGEEKKTLDPTFEFGPFKPYIAEGKMPEQSALTDLQRKWDDLATIVETLSANGIDSVQSIAVKAAAQPQQEEERPRKGKAKAKVRAKAKEAESAHQPLTCTYVVACKSRPAALVKTLNALATGDRFMAVEDFTIRREKDTIAESLGAAEKKEEATQTTGRRRRRSEAFETEAKAAEKAADAPLYTLVTNPADELPLDIQLTIGVYDFRSFEEKKEGEVEK